MHVSYFGAVGTPAFYRRFAVLVESFSCPENGACYVWICHREVGTELKSALTKHEDAYYKDLQVHFEKHLNLLRNKNESG
jgi:hypothetical protein